MRARYRYSIALIVAALLAGCSTFNRDWKAMASEPIPGGVDGRWDGRWSSDASGHDGALRCIVSTDEAGATTARYRATYAGILSYEYSVPMVIERDGALHRFAAEADLGWLAGGVYEYEGTISGDAFHATYSCSRDHGTFEMQRVGGAIDPAPDDR